MALYLGIDTSNYTTSLAVFDSEKDVLKSYRTLLFVSSGEVGLRQNDAVFLHVKNLPELFKKAGEEFSLKDLSGIAVSISPRRKEGSYMPCFLPGVMAAKALSASLRIPLFCFSHQEGHLMAGLYKEHRELLCTSFIALHFSGGTADIMLATPNASGIGIKEIGKSLDITAGQLIDRVGVSLSTPFPAGKEMDEAALKGRIPYEPRVSVKDYDFNLSGFQNQCEKLKETGESPQNISAYLFEAIAKTLEKVFQNIKTSYPGKKILLVGGVMSSQYLREYFKNDSEILFGDREFCTDNAVGTALLGAAYGGK